MEELLENYGWKDRFVALSQSTLPVVAEIQRDGTMEIATLTRLEFSAKDAEMEKPPKLIAIIQSGETLKIDVGQLTTLWSAGPTAYCPPLDDRSTFDPIPLAQIDKILEILYQRARVGSSSKRGWTKKQLQQRIDQIPIHVSFVEKSTMEAALRQIAKAGPNHEQLVDSMDLMSLLPKHASNDDDTFTPRVRAALLLGGEQGGGGRFKRFPCLPIAWNAKSQVVSIVNGGWIAVDSAVRATREAQALAQTGTSRGTSADERIVQRLEYLAGCKEDDTQPEVLQVDVRELLKAMDLPYSSQGAREALVQMGIWSKDNDTRSGNQPQPWPPEVLQAVQWYQAMDQKRTTRLKQCLLQPGAGEKMDWEGRINLTHLPSICIDAARTSFRDDALGIRPRKGTGRKISPSSKWEILIHTTDVSDLYSPTVVGRSEKLKLLQDAAAKRGSSRYDLPSGPLHLLPPSLLEILSLQTRSMDSDDDNDDFDTREKTTSVNRCVTVWVYIDETTGELLDAGFERTLISAPLALTFQAASDLLEGKQSNRISRVIMEQSKAMLAVLDRDLQLWREYRRGTSASAKAREERLETREQIDRQIYGDSNGYNPRDDGREGYLRTRGHRLVDTSLEIQGLALSRLLKRANACIPFVAGTERDGRVATAPLRRYIDGMVQRQALAVLCGYGGVPLTKSECVEIGLQATNAINAQSTVQAFKSSVQPRVGPQKAQKQQQAARALLYQLSQGGSDQEFQAMSTGRQSEVVILGFGAVASCRGINGTLKPGEKVMVSIRQVDPTTGKVSVMLRQNASARKQTTRRIPPK